MKTYIVMSFGEDGDPPSFDQLTEVELQERLREKYYGDRPVFAEPGKKFEPSRFIGVLIIKGEIVKPKPKTVVTEYEL